MTITMTRTAAPQPRTASGRWLLGALLLAPFIASADATIANVATPSIPRRLTLAVFETAAYLRNRPRRP